ncbi:hypothetical protein MMC31_001847 [Peltigera leucophlebia]|nr:hypothetical protein [Peltigera leucophlebia]
MKDRSNKDCRNRWMKINDKWSRGAWSGEENERLAGGIIAHGYRWTLVSEVVGSRSPDQCAKHWRNSLDPDIIRGEWTDREDETLMLAVRIHGKDWKQIGLWYLRNRSSLDLSNRYNLHVRQVDKLPLSALSNMDSLASGELDRDTQLETHTHTVPSILSTSYNTTGIDYPGPVLRSSPIDLDPSGQDFSSPFSSSFDGDFVDTEPFHCSAICSSEPTHGLSFDDFSTEASFSSTNPPRSTFQCYTGQDLESLAWIGNQDTGHDEPSQLEKTTFTMENLDSETRAQILDILCKRRVLTTIAVKD